MSSKRLAAATLAAGLAIVAAAQILAPLHAPPLYDGVVVEEPYRYLSPGPGQAGNPTSASVVKPLEKGESPALSAPTAESPPQAQLIAPTGSFAVPSGTTDVRISITPVAPAPADSIVGNAYRLAVTNQAGVAVPLATGSLPTLVLRAPPEASDVRIVQLVGGAWQELATQSAGQPSAYLANIGALGDFAIRGSVTPSGTGFDPIPVALVGLASLGTVVVLLLVLRPTRDAPPAPAPPARGAPGPRK